MGPLIPNDIIPADWNNAIALLLGMAFGFVLEASGFSSSRRIMGTFFGYDFVVLRVFFTAAVTSMIGILYLDYFGWVDFGQLYIHPTYLMSAIIGGVIMGFGFALGGYCPGTSYCAVAIGKLDALAYSIGLFIGIYLFTFAYPLLEGLYNGSFMGYVTAPEVMGINQYLFVFFVVIAALGMFFVATIVQRKVKKVEY
ncbi:MAG TPA: YeeE/YedE thiosulfate transporter family protein [Bacteroidales bacterium]|jgi:uncharacterized membrane protein YedE/YeeE|nr:YeeE/YedE family protein [Bacteroidales bacterium]MDX9906327.1 YeeE/YedE thiosulfate transporter family protein [Bacteroidales bacterium]HNQ83009.1 YeeE/YedE thiosulfate transporter family protein [Bacteroidales bacterium]HOX76704.1 YeeE/YedE thiosulfate transporter family protein [Bacteroidales bacterium]HPI87005.1 YeeE/YedE thiosulfate transporter family protein [Bacteroidales bacterium]